MSPMAFRVYLDRLRRCALRQGLRLSKTRTRDPRSRDFRGYTLSDVKTKKVGFGRRPDGFLPELFEIEQRLFWNLEEVPPPPA
jgi:hypothetical protein